MEEIFSSSDKLSLMELAQRIEVMRFYPAEVNDVKEDLLNLSNSPPEELEELSQKKAETQFNRTYER